jgi:nucleoside-diphosphate-sugar epimerase
MKEKTALVLGAGGFIGNHLVSSLKREGFWVRGVDLKEPEYSTTKADDFQIFDLREHAFYCHIFDRDFDEVYQLAADMGGAGYIFSGANDADIISNNMLININVVRYTSDMRRYKIGKLFYSSSACAYPAHNQTDPNNPICSEASAFPANPDSVYGWEKLCSEILYRSFARNKGMNVRIARFHNIFGELSCWNNGREKSPAALCRKVAEALPGGIVEVWGTGEQTRSFLYIEECLEAVRRLMDSDCTDVVNIGSEEIISMNDLVKMISGIADKPVVIKNIESLNIGVMGRNSDNELIYKKLRWAPTKPLIFGMERLYNWIEGMIHGDD